MTVITANARDQSHFARYVAYATLALVALVAAGTIYLGPQITSVKDTSDLQACRAEVAALLNDAKDARDQATFDGLVASVQRDPEALAVILAAAPEIKAEIARRREQYLRAIRDSRDHPDSFLAHCRR